MSEVKESSAIIDVLSLIDAPDGDQERHLLLTVLFESGTTVRLPMTEEAAAKALLLLDRARERRGWKLRDAPINEDKIQ
jgi:hypothetical protein